MAWVWCSILPVCIVVKLKQANAKSKRIVLWGANKAQEIVFMEKVGRVLRANMWQACGRTASIFGASVAL
ncbi:unnamed protein product [Gongylonema pulchrum]|uniref:Secreted protein n=1 Tax=Gongylonema pulchrum TaxID=637853 RepID=A0A183F1P2_9BILA|nr:unnamed protein product [Gongylonema pulchrum]